MNIKENVTIINQWPDRDGYKVEGIVIHSMWGFYNGSIQWFKNPKAKASAHYCIKADGEITKTVEESHAAWHAGNVTVQKDKAPQLIKDRWGINPNLITVGVELEDKRNKWYKYPQSQYKACVELAADICKRYDLSPDRGIVIMHKELDPINRSDPVGNWDQNKFIEDVKIYIEKGGVEIKLYPLETTVGIVVPALYVRHGPSRGEALAGSREIKKGDIIDVDGFVEGEDIEGNKFWYKSAKGNYFWAGGTNKPHPELTLDGQKKNMTSVEKEARLVELENMKAALDARKAELEAALVENQAGYVEYDNKVAEFESEPVVDEVVETVAEAPVEEVVEPVAEEVVETPEDVAQRNKLEEMYAWLKETLGK